CPRLVFKNVIDNLLRCLPAKRAARERIVRLSDCRKEDAQTIVNFGRCCDGRSRISPGAALLNGDSGRKSFDEIDVRLFHLIEELPRVRREAFDVTPLPFWIKRVKGER